MNILVAINKTYFKHFIVMINSFFSNNSGNHSVYIVSNDINNEDIEQEKDKLPNCNYYVIKFNDNLVKDAPKIKWWTKEVYYRLFAKEYLPKEVDRILYLDCDLIVKGNIETFYNGDFKDNYYIGSTNIHSALFKKFLQIKNGAKKNSIYINTGVLLINLKLLREEQDLSKIIPYIKRKGWLLCCPDQDIIHALYGDKILLCDGIIYNLSDRAIKYYKKKYKRNITLEWVDENVKIIHYIGKNKPWNEDYKGILKPYYENYKGSDK